MSRLETIKSWPYYSGIFLLSWSALTLEICLIRLLAVSYWYHFAWMVISLALLGIGASGTFLSISPRFFRADWSRFLPLFSLCFSLFTLGGFWLSNRIPFDPLLLTLERRQLAYLFLFYLLFALPFFFFGSVIALILTRRTAQAGKSYAANLLGSALGCLSPLWTFSLLGGVRSTALAAAGGAVAAVCFSFLHPPRKRWFWGILALLLCLFIFSPGAEFPIQISQYKGLSGLLLLPDAKTLFQGWNALARLDVVESRYIRLAQGMSLNYSKSPPPQLALAYDGGNLSPINRFEGDWENVAFCDYLTSSLPFHLIKKPDVLLIGPGGGTPLLTALYHQPKSIVGLELNPMVIRLMKERFADFSGNIYNQPTVSILPEEGRSFLQRSSQHFDLIQIPLLDSFAAASSGVYSLSENYLYTTDSFRDLYQHLTDKGIASITRWLRYPPRDALRIFATAIESLRTEGIRQPGKHLVFLRGWATGTILIKKSEFTPEELEIILAFCQKRGFDPVHIPGNLSWEPNHHNRLPQPVYYQAARALLNPETAGRFIQKYPFAIAPPRDEKPFFYDFFKLRTLSYFLPRLGKEWIPFGEWGYLVLLAALIQAGAASFVFILLPLWLRRRQTARWPRSWLYFSSLGIGFMFVEISLIQKLILFLGHPIYAVSVVIFSLLLFSGVGSWFSDKINSPYRLIASLVTLVIAILLVLSLISPLLSLFFALPTIGRLFTVIIVLAPVGFLMGIPFPAGLKMAGGEYPALIPWAWAVNGCSSILASILAVMVATAGGFTVVLFLAALAYGLAAGAVFSWRKTY